MKINFKATNITLNEALRSYAEVKLSAVGKLLVGVGSGGEPLVDVELGRVSQHHKHGEVFRAEVNFHWSGSYFRSEATATDLYAAIDQVKDELSRELKTWRQKRETLFRRGARSVKGFFRRWYR